MKHFGIAILAAGVCCSAALASDLNMSVKADKSGTNTVEVAPDEVFTFYIEGLLSDDMNEGLALVGFNLHFTGGPLAVNTVDIPMGDISCGNPMPNFVKPEGITNPAGYRGTLIGDDLIQVGGAQNTINNTMSNAPFPIGMVLTGIAQTGGDAPCGTAVIASGTLTAPSGEGAYTLELSELFANVITFEETGGVFWAAEAAGVGTIDNLTVNVTVACPPDNNVVASTVDSTILGIKSLWRTKNNLFILTFNDAVASLPGAGDILIQEMLDDGLYGDDLSSNFSFVSVDVNGVKIKDTSVDGVLADDTWYAIRNATDCDGIGNFLIQTYVQVGDQDGNGFVTPIDVGNVNAGAIGPLADDSRFDIDGNGFGTPFDVGITNANQGPPPPKPTGH
ncbi:MAG: hypothetical protein IID35_03250 [Planctomycetes bacterium]|nr:hypothetical protein [Planctomycetota bacterium]